MADKTPGRPKVSLFGVSRNALILGRACALQDNPVLGIYDPDPQQALRAALFLGVSARATPEALLKDGPDVILYSLPLTGSGTDETLLIRLGPKEDSSGAPNVCWADAGTDDNEIPTQIPNELPKLEFLLSGTDEARQRASDFFSGLPLEISLR